MISMHVYLSVCLHGYLRNHASERVTKYSVHVAIPMAVARSFTGRDVRRYVLPVLWMKSYLPIMGPRVMWRYRSSSAAVSYA